MDKDETIAAATRVAKRDGIEMRVVYNEYHEEPYGYQPADWGTGKNEETVTIIQP